MSNAVSDGKQDFGEYTMRIPENEYHILMTLLPDLNSRDAEIRKAAWKEFWHSPLADSYRMARSPQQVRRSNNHKIIVK